MPEVPDSFRIDFEMTVIKAEDGSGTFKVFLEPNPLRYEWRERDGERLLYDKFDDIYFPEKVLAEFAPKLNGLPVYFQPQSIGDAKEYINSRIPLIQQFLDGNERKVTFEDKSEKFLESLEKDELKFVIMSVDIVKSTHLATSTNPKIYTKLISTILHELSEVLPKFNGHILKYTGDGIIAYFPEPSFITMNDHAIDCALTLRQLIYKALNPVFEKKGFPKIDIRVGLDAGEAYIETIGSSETKQHKDIIGAVVNLAAKIQSRAGVGEIHLGNTVERNLHTMWRQICEPVEPDETWEYKDKHGILYKVFKITS